MRAVRQVLIATLITLVVIEVILQVTSLFATPMLERSGELGTDTAITILCVGDSHTYGAPLPEQDAYPAQLQDALEERYPDREWNVINLGFPGTNSSFSANRLEDQLLQIKPHIVMVSAGANNLWNKLDSGTRTADQQVSALQRVLLNIKLYRLLTIASSVRQKERYQAPTYEGPEGEGSRWFTEKKRKEIHLALTQELKRNPAGTKKTNVIDAAYVDGLRIDMKRIKQLTSDAGVPLIWFNYPWRHVRQVIDTIDQLSEELDITVVRGQLDFERALADGYKFNDLFHWAMGAHPSALMYHYIVESMVPEVAAELKDAHGIELTPRPSGLGTAPASPRDG